MENELRFEARKLSSGEQENLRKKIVREMQKRDGRRGAPKEVAEVCECSVSHVQSTWKKYRDGGVAGIRATKMGRPENSGRLTKEQQAEIKKAIVDKCPNQLKLKGFLWDREQTRALIKQRFGVQLSLHQQLLCQMGLYGSETPHTKL